MEATSVMALKFYHIFQSTTTFLDHIQFVFNKDGLTFDGMDASHVCLIKSAITADEFKSYRLLHGVPGSFGVSLKHLTRVLKHANGDDTLTLLFDPHSPKQVLNVELTGPDRSFTVPLPLIDIDEDTLEVPDVKYGFVMSLIPKVWHSYVATFDVIEPHTISLFPTHDQTEHIMLKGEGDVSDMSMTIRADRPISPDDPASIKRDLTRQTKILTASGSTMEVPLSSSMLSQMGGFAKSMMKLEVCMEEGMPALFRYTNGETIKVDIYLAPKIMDD